MEKISNIVRGSSRVASVDLKNSSALRPGVPSFGRPMGESSHVNEKTETTAARAAAIQAELNEVRRGNNDHSVQQMSNEFFNNRIRPSEVETLPSVTTGKVKVAPVVRAEEFEPSEEMNVSDPHESEITQPAGFTPRGSYVDVRV